MTVPTAGALGRAESETLGHIVGAGLACLGDVAGVAALHQRSLCYRVDLREGQPLFVKRARRGGDGRISARVAHEGAVLQAVRALGLPVPAPRLVLDDPSADLQLLVTDHLAGHETLTAARTRPDGRSAQLGRELGSVLAAVHEAPLERRLEARLTTADPHAAVLAGYCTVTPARYAEMSPGSLAVAAWLREHGVVDALHHSSAQWEPSAVVHGDVKSDNVLLSTTDAGFEIRLVDWELGGWGDPRYDVGSLLGDAYATWLGSVSFRSGGTLEEWLAGAEIPWAELSTQMAAALQAYESRRPVSPADRLQWYRYAGLFLVQRACASSIKAAALGPRSAAFLQVGAQLLLHPERHVGALSGATS